MDKFTLKTIDMLKTNTYIYISMYANIGDDVTLNDVIEKSSFFHR